MADNNFKGGPGGRLKEAESKFNKPTTQDSLDLYNQAQVINKFYGSNPNYQKISETPFAKYLKQNNTNYNELLKEPESIFGVSLLTRPLNIKNINEEFGTKTTAKELENRFKNKGIFKTYPNLLLFTSFYKTTFCHYLCGWSLY